MTQTLQNYWRLFLKSLNGTIPVRNRITVPLKNLDAYTRYQNSKGHNPAQKRRKPVIPIFVFGMAVQHITGYIEAKKPGTNLDQVETTDQLKRYLKTFPNLILTDFYEFRLYGKGKLIKTGTNRASNLLRKS
jgi:hypothetical protein